MMIKTTVQQQIDWLAQFGLTEDGGVTRLLYSAPWQQAQQAVAQRMIDGGLAVEIDAVGNVFGRVQGATDEVILTGSHVDTVVNGGKLDGAYGVIASMIAVTELYAQHGKPKKTLEVVSLCEEEGSRFPLTFWGSRSVVGQFDPSFTTIMNEVMDMLRALFQTTNKWAFPIDGTSRAGNEAVLASIIEKGDTVLVPVYGRFGHLLVEIAERYGANVVQLNCEWGDVFDEAHVIEAIHTHKPKIVALVHGETSTGRMQPLAQIGRYCREHDVLLVVDAVASIGGVDVRVDEWCIDACIGGTQKCLSIPAGMAPITFNERVVLARKKVERGIATAEDEQYAQNVAIASNYFDLAMLMDYWSPRRLNHHTEATTMLYALREGVRIALEERLAVRFARHAYHAEALEVGLRAMGLTLFGERVNKLTCVTCVHIPAHIDGERVRAFMLEHFGVEIASSFGSLHGKIWRIGTMGYSCRKENVLAVLSALEAALLYEQANIARGEALQAALHFYTATKGDVQCDMLIQSFETGK